jgi:Rod binding domain-containing protein
MIASPNLDAAAYTAQVTSASKAAAAYSGGASSGVSLASIHGMTQAQRLAKATAAAKDFEAFFVTSMMESMYAGVKTDKLFGGGSGEQMYRSLLNQEYGKVIAQRDVLGMADEVRAEMLRTQEKRN